MPATIKGQTNCFRQKTHNWRTRFDLVNRMKAKAQLVKIGFYGFFASGGLIFGYGFMAMLGMSA